MCAPDGAFGEQLRQLRLRAGLSQEALAERAGLAAKAIAALERGARRSPYPRTLGLLGEALGLSAAERAALADVASRGAQRRGQARTPSPSPQAPAVQPSRLPVWLTSFVGRAAEIETVRALLDPAGAAVRLLTLLGPGGVGKTRLAVAVAATLADRFPAGVVFVDLAPLHDVRLMPATIAHGLGLREGGRHSARELLLEYLRARRVLLVLDNFEHLLPAASLVAELAQQGPHLAVLVTSRAALRVQGEQRFLVEPLAVASGGAGAAKQVSAAAPAVQLFVARAQAVASDFALTERTAATVASICHRLEGLPLAIELAAARVPLLAPEALLLRLERRLPLLSSGPADLPERQQTLRATLAWSYDLLSAADQVLLRRLAVFAGGWTLAAAEAICADAALPAGAVLDHLRALVDSSLVRRLETSADEPRFGLLETIREYAWEHLAAGGEVEEVRRRHAAYYLALAEQANAGLAGPDKGRWLDRLDAEHENLRQALDWCLSGPAAAADGLRLAVALWLFWQLHGFLSEGRVWLERVLAATAGDDPAAVRARALAYAGHAAWLQGDATRAVALSEVGLALCRSTGQELSEAAAYCRRNLVAAAVERGDYERAHDLAEESVAVAQALDDGRSLAHALFERGRVAFFQGELTAARLAFEESLAAHRDLGDRPMVASVLGFLGRVATEQGDYVQTRRHHAESLAIKRELGLRRHAAFSLTDLGLAARLQGDFAEAHGLYAESLAIFRETGDRGNLVWALEGQAGLLAAMGQAAPAARLLGAAAALRTAAGTPVPAVERERVAADVAAVRGWLGETAFAAAWGAGQRMRAEQAIADALQELDLASAGATGLATG